MPHSLWFSYFSYFLFTCCLFFFRPTTWLFSRHRFLRCLNLPVRIPRRAVFSLYRPSLRICSSPFISHPSFISIHHLFFLCCLPSHPSRARCACLARASAHAILHCLLFSRCCAHLLCAAPFYFTFRPFYCRLCWRTPCTPRHCLRCRELPYQAWYTVLPSHRAITSCAARRAARSSSPLALRTRSNSPLLTANASCLRASKLRQRAASRVGISRRAAPRALSSSGRQHKALARAYRGHARPLDRAVALSLAHMYSRRYCCMRTPLLYLAAAINADAHRATALHARLTRLAPQPRALPLPAVRRHKRTAYALDRCIAHRKRIVNLRRVARQIARWYAQKSSDRRWCAPKRRSDGANLNVAAACARDTAY